MDAFFASVEQRDKPELRGLPVIVGGSPESRAVVCAASYEARKFGVRSAMSCAAAKRLCPKGIFVYPRFDAYTAASNAIHEVLETVTDLIEPLSLDEAYLDVTENKFNERSATRLAEYLKKTIKEKTGLIASAGVSYNKFLAKLAGDLKKPDGLMVIRPEDVDQILPSLPVGRLWGVGKKTEERLHQEGFFKISDLRRSNVEYLSKILGSMGEFIWDLSHGIDEREVDNSSDRKSVGSERTFDQDVISPFVLSEILEEMTEEITEYLKEKHWLAMTYTVKVKYHDFKQVTRSHTFRDPMDSKDTVYRQLKELLLKKTDAGNIPVRLLGVSASHLIFENDPIQLYFEFIKD